MSIQYFLAVIAVILCIPLVSGIVKYVELDNRTAFPAKIKLAVAFKRFTIVIWTQTVILIGISGLVYILKHPLNP